MKQWRVVYASCDEENTMSRARFDTRARVVANLNTLAIQTHVSRLRQYKTFHTHIAGAQLQCTTCLAAAHDWPLLLLLLLLAACRLLLVATCLAAARD